MRERYGRVLRGEEVGVEEVVVEFVGRIVFIGYVKKIREFFVFRVEFSWGYSEEFVLVRMRVEGSEFVFD